MSEVAASPAGQNLLNLYEQFYVLIRRTFAPYQGREAIVAMSRARRAGQKISRLVNGAESLQYPLITAYSVDGISFGILGLISRAAIATPFLYDGHLARGAADQIHNILQGLTKPIDPALRQDWNELAKKFAVAVPAP